MRKLVYTCICLVVISAWWLDSADAHAKRDSKHEEAEFSRYKPMEIEDDSRGQDRDYPTNIDIVVISIGPLVTIAVGCVLIGIHYKSVPLGMALFLILTSFHVVVANIYHKLGEILRLIN